MDQNRRDFLKGAGLVAASRGDGRVDSAICRGRARQDGCSVAWLGG